MKKKILTALLCAAILLSSPLGDMPLTVGAAAYESEPSAEEVTYLDLEYAASTLAAPTASRESGTIFCSKDYATVKLSAEKGTVYYSLNGAKYKKYTSAIKLTKNSTIKAYAKSGSSKSETVTFTYKLQPKFTVSTTNTSDGKNVKLTTKVSGVKFYYTTDGSKPTTSSKAYPSSGITLTETSKLRVIAVKSGWSNTSFTKNFTVTAKPSTATTSKPSTNADQFVFDAYGDTLLYIGSGNEEIIFPSEFDGKPVKSVNFYETQPGVTSVTIPNGVTSIKAYTFESWKGLKSVTVPPSVTSIGRSAFRGCPSLKSVTIPNGVTRIESFTFDACTSLKSMTIPDSVTFIDGSAFANCTSLKSVTIPDSVKGISSSAFRNCTSLKSVTLPNSMIEISENTFAGCTSLKSVTIPDGVTSICKNAFEGCTSLKSVTIPDSVTSIGAGIFTDIMMGIVNEDEGAFAGCNCTIIYKGKKYTSADHYEALYTAINGKKPPVEYVEANLY